MASSADWRATNRHLPIVRAAEEGGYGVLAAIAYNIEQILGLRGRSWISRHSHLSGRQLNGRARITLHGTDGFPADLLRRCVEAGPVKINVNKLVLDDYYAYVRAETGPQKSHTSVMEGGVEKVVNQTVERMHIVGSAGRAESS